MGLTEMRMKRVTKRTMREDRRTMMALIRVILISPLCVLNLSNLESQSVTMTCGNQTSIHSVRKCALTTKLSRE